MTLTESASKLLEVEDTERIKLIGSTFHPNTHKWIHDQIDQSQGKRDWSSLPSGFEQNQVQSLVKNKLKDHFPKKAVALKVNAYKATTHDELRDIINKVKVRSEE
jgi:hypothetical protein